MKLSFLPNKYKYTVSWSISSILGIFQKSQIYTNYASLSSTFSQFSPNPKSSKFLKLHFDVFDDFLHRNSIEKKTFIWGDNGFFFVITVFFSFLGDNKAQKKTVITKQKPLSQYFAKFRVYFGQFWAKKPYIIPPPPPEQFG